MLYDDLVGPQGTWLCHHGVKGQKWGVRRYQNKDGTLTPREKARRSTDKYAKNSQKNIIKDKNARSSLIKKQKTIV